MYDEHDSTLTPDLSISQHPQGSCNVDIGFPSLFVGGSHVASAFKIVSVMGTMCFLTKPSYTP